MVPAVVREGCRAEITQRREGAWQIEKDTLNLQRHRGEKVHRIVLAKETVHGGKERGLDS